MSRMDTRIKTHDARFFLEHVQKESITNLRFVKVVCHVS